MIKKRDMYIDYKRSFKKRGRRKNKLPLAFLVMLLLAAVGIGAYYLIKDRMNSNKYIANTQEITLEEQLPVQASVTQGSTGEVQNIVSPTVTVKPTLLPTMAPAQEEVAPVMDIKIPVKAKGIYVTSSVAGSDILDSLITLVDTTEINAMVIDVKDDHGKISFQMDSAMAQEIDATTKTIKDIDVLIQKLKEHNIYLIARIVAFKDPYLADKRKDLAIKNKDGTIYLDSNGEGWVNPYNHQVWDYLIEIASEAAAVGFDEVQFDYIRFSTGSGIAKADFGQDAKNKSKEVIISEFTKYAYENLKPLGVYVSADVYGTIISSSIDAGLVGQNYIEMAKYLDYICPMIYPSHFGEGNYGIEYPDLEPFEIIRKALIASQEKLDQIPEDEHRAIVRPWLQDFTATWIKHHMKYGANELKEQIEGVYGAGYEEWILWNASCKYSEDGLQAE